MYKISVQKITDIVYDEYENRYFNKKTGAEERYNYKDEEEQVTKKMLTGKKLQRTEQETIFEQKLEDLDIKKLATFLNQ